MSHEGRRFDPAKCSRLIAPERWERWTPPALLALAGLKAEQAALDLGSGPGFWTLPMAQIVGPSGQVIALDVSAQLLQTLADRQPPAQVRIVRCELPKIDLPDDSVEFVWAAFVYHEVEPATSLVTEIRRVLRPGGRVAVLDWRPDALGSDGPPRPHRIAFQQVMDALLAGGFRGAAKSWENADGYLVTADR